MGKIILHAKQTIQYFLPSNADFMAVKFLRARQFQMDKAVALFQQCHQWRMEHNADTLAAKNFCPTKS